MKTKRRLFLVLIAAAAAALLLAASEPAHAGYIATMQQVGANVILDGSGAIDVTGFSAVPPGNWSQGNAINASHGIVTLGPTGMTDIDLYSGISITGPASFGSGGDVDPNTGSGDHVRLQYNNGQRWFAVPRGYVSGTPLAGSDTFDNETFSSLGVTPGTYEWTWGSGLNQNFTLQIGAANTIPDTGSTIALLLLGCGALSAATRFKRTAA